MSVIKTVPQFLYPCTRRYSFDEVARNIIIELEKRNFKVPGITVEFDIYGSGEAKYKKVKSVCGDNFRLEYNRIQGKNDTIWNDTAAISDIYIPQQILEVYGEKSEALFILYVGKNWEKDKEWFMNSIKVHSKYNGEPKRYLKYRGGYRLGSRYLIPDDDCNREYLPEKGEPLRIEITSKYLEIAAWIKSNVLEYILNFPEALSIDPEKPIEVIPYSGTWKTVYSICSRPKDIDRIRQGKENPNQLVPEKRHAWFGSGVRLVTWDVRCNERFPNVAYDGFIWCDVNKIDDINSKTMLSSEVEWAMKSLSDTDYIVTINLKYANDVYVVDNSRYTETRERLFDEVAPRDWLTDEEYADVLAARGATIIPITEYTGNYKDPILLIRRELEFDEIGEMITRKNY